jgi:hypothetical protein
MAMMGLEVGEHRAAEHIQEIPVSAAAWRTLR